MDKVSVIIPVFNTQEFIDKSVSSLLQQSHNNLEIIIINDNSNEACKEQLEHLASKDDRIILYHFKENKGVGSARNFGLKKATGEYIYFLDSDDFLPNHTIEILVNHISTYNMVFGKIKKTHLSEFPEDRDKHDNNNDTELEDYYDDEFNDHLDEAEQEVRFYSDKKYRLIKNKSVLSILFRRSFIKDNKLRFLEEVRRYSDLAFIVPAILEEEEIPYVKEAVYYKRRRNDPISNPALLQAPPEERIKDFIYIYIRLKNTYDDEKLHKYLDEQFFNFYRKVIVKYFKKNENVSNVFNSLIASVNRLSMANIKNKSSFIKKELKCIKKGDINRFKKLNLNHHRKRKVKRALKGRTKFLVQLYRAVFLKLPIKEDMIVFESFLGKSYSDSPKYIYEYMLRNNMNYKYVWVFNESKQIPGNAVQVKRFSIKYYYYMARSKYWVSNSRLPKTLNKRQGNIYLQTWHGTPLKTLVFDMKDIYSADPKYKKNFYKQSRRWDYLSSPNAYSSEIFRRAFKYEKPLLEFGYPRNDILYQKNNKQDINKLKSKINIPKDKKVILYAPTWRDDEFIARGKYKFELKLKLDELQEELGDQYIVLLRMHYFIADNLDVSAYKGFVYDFSRYEDIAELYLISDILITDYSSVFFDYANLRRPILFYTYDLDKYRDKLRGFYIDIEKEVPGPLLMTTSEVIKAINNIEEVNKEFKLKYDDFHLKFCKWDDGNAARKTVKAVFDKD